MAGGGHGEFFVGDDCFAIDFCCDWRSVRVDDVDLFHGADCVIDFIGELHGISCWHGCVRVVAVHCSKAELFAVSDCGGNV